MLRPALLAFALCLTGCNTPEGKTEAVPEEMPPMPRHAPSEGKPDMQGRTRDVVAWAGVMARRDTLLPTTIETEPPVTCIEFAVIVQNLGSDTINVAPEELVLQGAGFDAKAFRGEYWPGVQGIPSAGIEGVEGRMWMHPHILEINGEGMAGRSISAAILGPKGYSVMQACFPLQGVTREDSAMKRITSLALPVVHMGSRMDTVVMKPVR